jgi:hypothetical protein
MTDNEFPDPPRCHCGECDPAAVSSCARLANAATSRSRAIPDPFIHAAASARS